MTRNLYGSVNRAGLLRNSTFCAENEWSELDALEGSLAHPDCDNRHELLVQASNVPVKVLGEEEQK